MPDDVKISEMSEAASLDNSAQFPYVQSMNGILTTLKAPLSQIGTKLNEGMTFSNLQTTSKNIVGAINEAAQGGGVEYATELPISSTDPTDTKSYIDTKTTLVKSASGSLVHITDGGDNIPMKSLVSEIVAVESGSGEKSPTNPYTISGFANGVIKVSNHSTVVETLTQVYVDASGIVTNSLPDYPYRCVIARVNQGKQYTYSVNGVATTIPVLAFFDKYPLVGTQSYNSSRLLEQNATFTAPINGFVFIRGSGDYNEVNQMVASGTSTDYEQGTTYTFAFGQTVYGGHFDNKGNLVVTHKEINLSTLSWSATTLGSQNVWRASLPNDCKGYADNFVPTNILCEQYEPNSVDNMYSGYSGISLRISGSYIYCSRTDLNEPQGKLIAELITPITLSITSQDIPTLSGVNNIFSNCGDLDIEYFTSSADEVADLIREQPMPLHHYSLGEVEIGTWIDGSTLYEKTIQITSLSVGTATLQHGIFNFDTLVSVSGRFTRADGKQSPISNVSTDTKSMVYASNFTDTSFVLFIGDNYQGATALTSMYLTLQYTKTS